MSEDKPQIPPPRFPVREFTTPNFADGFYTEVFKRTDPAYMAVQVPKRGTVYSTIQGANPQVIAQFPNLYFLKETRLGQSHEWVMWVWGTDPTAEDSYNAMVSYTGDAIAYPNFQRVRTVRRDVYENSPVLSPKGSLTSLLAVHISGAGANYTQATGVTGTGATVTFVCSGGHLIAGIVTNGGAACTQGGTITITGDGTGGTATAIVQPTGAVLVGQKKQEFPNDSPLRNEYVEVLLRYETLPGPIITSLGYNTQYNTPTTTYRQRVALPATPDTPGAILNGEVVFDSEVNAGDSTVVGEKITTTWEIPPTRIEAESIGYQFPAQFTFIGAWVSPPPVAAGGIPGPYAGVNYELTAHRTLSTPASTVISYSNGDPGSLPAIYRVVTPGAADRFFGIQANTIHGDIFIQGSSGMFTQVVEDLPASTPDSYTPGDTLTIRASKRLVGGTIWERRVSAVAE